MSTPAEKETSTPPLPQKPKINKIELLADVVAFFSIISSYFFIALTLHFNILESIFGVPLDSDEIIIKLFLLYAIFIIILRGISSLLEILLKNKSQNQIVKLINHQIGTSLFRVMVISALYLGLLHLWKEIALEKICHVTVWLWIAETCRVLGVFLGSATKIDSLSYWGTSIQGFLIIGGLLQTIDLGLFVVL